MSIGCLLHRMFMMIGSNSVETQGWNQDGRYQYLQKKQYSHDFMPPFFSLRLLSRNNRNASSDHKTCHLQQQQLASACQSPGQYR